MSDCLATWEPSDGQTKALSGAFMFADVSGFTALSEALQARGREGAEILNRIISDVFTSFVASIRGHGGDVLSFGGDAVLVHFPGSDHLDRAITAASEMRATLAAPLLLDGLAPTSLSVSIGIHAGEAMAVRVDLRQQVASFVVGPTVTRTLRAEAAAEAGEILLTHASAEQITGRWPTELTPSGALVVPSSMAPTAAADAGPPGPAVADLAGLIPPAIQRIAGTIEADGQHRRAAVGFVRLGRLDEVAADEGPEATHDVLAETFGVLAEECERTGVSMLTADSYPDSVKMLVAAGAPLATEDNDGALIDALQQTMGRLPGQDVHAGAHRGLVFAGDLGAPHRREYTLLGDTVNLAARLMQKAAPGEVIASADIIEQTAVARTPLPPFKVKGKLDDIVAHRVEAGDHQQALLDLALVNREAEVAQLDELAARALGGTLQLVEIAGAPGHGKSRLMREIEYRHPELEPFIGKATAYAMSTPYGLVRRLLRVLLRIPRQLPSIEAGTWLTDLVENVAADLVPEIPWIAQAIDARVPLGDAEQPVDPATVQRRVARATADLVGRARTDPMLVVVDDAQWLDNASRQLLRRIAIDNADRPWLFVAASREEDNGVFDGLPGRTAMALEPLEGSHARQLVRVAAGNKPLYESDVDRVVEQAKGNCLFLVEYARSPEAEIPADVEALIASRLDALDPGARRLLGVAAVVGTHPQLDVARQASLVVDGEAPSDSDWGQLQEYLEPIQRGGGAWGVHQVCEAVDSALPYQRRRDLHRAVHGIIESSPSDGSRARIVALATHADLGGMAQEAWELLRKSGEEAALEGASVEAVDLLSRAILWGDELGDLVDDDDRRHVLHRLAKASDLAGRFDDGVAAMTRALELGPDPDEAVKLLALRCRLHTQLGELDAADEDLDSAEGHLADHAPIEVRVDVLMGRATVEFRRDRLDRAFEHVQEVVSLDPSQVPPIQRARAFLIGDAVVASGFAANWMVGRGLPIFDLLGDDQGVGASHTNIGNVAYREGDWDRAVAHWEDSGRAHQLAGSLVDAATCQVNIAEVWADQGSWEEAVEAMEEARQTWRAGNYRIGLGFVGSLIGRSLARLGRGDEGLEELRVGREILETAGATGLAREAALREVEALWLLGRADEASSLLDEVTAAGVSDDLRAFTDLLGGALMVPNDAEAGTERLLRALHAAADAKRWFEYLMAHVLLAMANGRDASDSVDISALAKRLGIWRVATPAGATVVGSQPAGAGLVSGDAAP